jgi:hypothetical protein
VPIIINGGSRSAGGWWSKHLGNTKPNDRAELIEITGLSAETMREAFREMHGVSLGTKCTNYFYQANINPREDEHLTPAQWREAVDTLEKNLGLTGQPRFVVEHEKEGRTHRHVVWSRIDPDRMTAISDSLTAAIHERTSRELEIRFDLERGRSVLTRDREFERPERRPRKHETFRALETGIDPQNVKAEIGALWRSADNGQSFKAALEAPGYVLARGDRRDFVVVDRASDEHSLARCAGVKAAEVRERMKGIDPADLPSVAESRAQQRSNQAEKEINRSPEIDNQAARAVEREPRAGQPEPSRVPEPAKTEERPLAFVAAREVTELADNTETTIRPELTKRPPGTHKRTWQERLDGIAAEICRKCREPVPRR